MKRNNFVWKFATVATFALYLSQPQAAFSQALPWKSSGASVQQQAQPAPQHPYHQQSTPPAYTPPSTSEDTRESDDRKLDKLAGQFYHIHQKDKDAVEKLKKLEQQVQNFNASLKAKDGESDIQKDARKLKSRISKQLKKWEAAQNATSPIIPAMPAPTH